MGRTAASQYSRHVFRIVRCALLALLGVFVACDPEESTAPIEEPPPDPPDYIRPGRLHVFGADRLLGTYSAGTTAVEVTNSIGGEITTLSLFDRGVEPSGIVVSIDGLAGRTELISTRIGDGPWLPLTFWAGGHQRAAITPAGNVGIGETEPAQRLEVAGGVRLNTTEERPACGAAARGTLWFHRAEEGESDRLAVCLRGASGTYTWTRITPDVAF